MLKYPTRNFGRFPTLGFLLKAGWLIITRPTLSTMPWHRLNGSATAPKEPETFWSAVQKNKRLRYAKRHLAPFIARRYGIQLPVKTSDDLGAIMRSEMIIPLNSDNEYYLLGWDLIEDIANKTAEVKDLAGEIHLARIQNGAMTDAPRWDDSVTHDPATFSRATNFTPLAETEQNIKSLIGSILSSLPDCHVDAEIMAMNDETMFETIGAAMEMEILDGNIVVEDPEEYNNFTDTAVFTARIVGKGLFILSIELEDKTFICAYLIEEEGYGTVDKDSLNDMILLPNAEPGSVVFIDDMSILKMGR